MSGWYASGYSPLIVPSSSFESGRYQLCGVDDPYLTTVVLSFTKDPRDPLSLNILQGDTVKVVSETKDGEWVQIEVVRGLAGQVGKCGEVPSCVLARLPEKGGGQAEVARGGPTIEAYTFKQIIPEESEGEGMLRTRGVLEDSGEESDEESEDEESDAEGDAAIAPAPDVVTERVTQQKTARALRSERSPEAKEAQRLERLAAANAAKEERARKRREKKAAAAQQENTANLSAYEAERLKNIARNTQVLESLGLA